MGATLLSGCTVIIPCYNSGESVLRAIDSVRAQTHPPTALLVTNDGSSDPCTLDCLSQLPSSEVLHLPENRGLASARNHGIARSRTSYVALLDADDEYDPCYLEHMMRARRSEAAAGALTGSLLHFSENTRTAYARWHPRGGTFHDFFFTTRSIGAVVLKRAAWQAVGGYDERMREGLEDWEFFFRLTCAGYAVRPVWRARYHYYHRRNSLTSTYTEQQLGRALRYFFQKHRIFYETVSPVWPLFSVLGETFRNPKLLTRRGAFPMLKLVNERVYAKKYPLLCRMLRRFLV